MLKSGTPCTEQEEDAACLQAKSSIVPPPSCHRKCSGRSARSKRRSQVSLLEEGGPNVDVPLSNRLLTLERPTALTSQWARKANVVVQAGHVNVHKCCTIAHPKQRTRLMVCQRY
eukprot:INCI16191.2.p2 GENE.INCI16191.2~~INCI16191.2.p2  ORF type:complete len:115 (+),score=15.08 INCI16191.2:1365-1709(+)